MNMKAHHVHGSMGRDASVYASRDTSCLTRSGLAPQCGKCEYAGVQVHVYACMVPHA
jgi:hypothetical protein